MKSLILASLMILSSLSTHANEDSSVAVGMVIGGTTYGAGVGLMAIAGATILGPMFTTLNISGEGFKVIVDAQDDAAIFVATEGQIKGVQLAKAMQLIREATQGMDSTDMQLAESILSVQ